MNAPDNPHVKDAEACGKFLMAEWKREGRKKATPLTLETVKWLGTWAGHWARKAILKNEKSLE
jgi:hypothetical protein